MQQFAPVSKLCIATVNIHMFGKASDSWEEQIGEILTLLKDTIPRLRKELSR
jgi:hypothetical protein